MYAVGVGRAADVAELREIASQPEYVFTSSSFQALQSITAEIRRGFCDGKGFSLVSVQYFSEHPLTVEKAVVRR